MQPVSLAAAPYPRPQLKTRLSTPSEAASEPSESYVATASTAAAAPLPNTHVGAALAAFPVPALQAVARQILDYDVGFQAGRSYLKIYDDGTIEHQELVCCPPHKVPVTEKPLAPDDVRKLQSAIRQLAAAPLKSEPVEVSMGSRSGYLKVFGAQAQEVVVRQIDRTLDSGVYTYNTSPAVKDVLALVNRYVAEGLPEPPNNPLTVPYYPGRMAHS